MVGDSCRNINEVVSFDSDKPKLQKNVLNLSEIKHLFLYFSCVFEWRFFHTAFLPPIPNFEYLFQHEKQLQTTRPSHTIA